MSKCIRREELLTEGLSQSDFKIKNFKVTPTGSYGDVEIQGILSDWHINVSYTTTSDELAEIAYQSYMQQQVTQVENPEKVESFGEELDATLEESKPAFKLGYVDLMLKGFSKGCIVKRKEPNDEFHFNYGLYTGEYRTDEFNNTLLVFTDKIASYLEDCEVITDINKDIMRFVAAEQDRIRTEVELFNLETNNWLNELIFKS